MPGGTHSLLSLCEGTDTAREDQSSCSDTALIAHHLQPGQHTQDEVSRFVSYRTTAGTSNRPVPQHVPPHNKLQLTFGTVKSISMSTQTAANLLLPSKNRHLKWVPGYKMPTPTGSSAGLFLSRPHSRSNSRSSGKMGHTANVQAHGSLSSAS